MKIRWFGVGRSSLDQKLSETKKCWLPTLPEIRCQHKIGRFWHKMRQTDRQTEMVGFMCGSLVFVSKILWTVAGLSLYHITSVPYIITDPPENQPLETEIPNLETIIFRFHVKLWGGTLKPCFFFGDIVQFCHVDEKAINMPYPWDSKPPLTTIAEP